MTDDEVIKALNQYAEVYAMPYGVIMKVLDNERTFAIDHAPTEVESDDEPPTERDNSSDVITIDGMLGKYDPDTLQITIFKKGVARVADVLGASSQELKYIVQLHEWAHAFLHTGLYQEERSRLAENVSLWPEVLKQQTLRFQALDETLHERLAQLLTYHGLKSLQRDATSNGAREALGRVTKLFEDLSQRSPAPYKINEYATVPMQRLLKSISLLRNGGIVGAEAWETVMLW